MGLVHCTGVNCYVDDHMSTQTGLKPRGLVSAIQAISAKVKSKNYALLETQRSPALSDDKEKYLDS